MPGTPMCVIPHWYVQHADMQHAQDPSPPVALSSGTRRTHSEVTHSSEIAARRDGEEQATNAERAQGHGGGGWRWGGDKGESDADVTADGVTPARPSMLAQVCVEPVSRGSVSGVMSFS